MTKRGRRAGDPELTRQTILAAARRVFAEKGYERTTIRAIAADAGVDPALIHHHYGSKQDLFIAAHDMPITPGLLAEAFDGTEGSTGERLARAYLGAAFGSERIESLVRSAASNEQARRMLREFLERVILDGLEERVAGPDARLRLALAGAHLIGVVMVGRIVGVDAVSGAPLDEIVRRVGAAIDRHLEVEIP